MWVKLTELSWMWAEGRESSDLQPRPSLSGSESLHRAILWSGLVTLAFVHRALWDPWVKVPRVCHFRNTVKALKLNVLGSAIGNRKCLPEPQSQCLSSRLLSGCSRIWNWYWETKKRILPDPYTEKIIWTWKEKMLLVDQRVSTRCVQDTVPNWGTMCISQRGSLTIVAWDGGPGTPDFSWALIPIPTVLPQLIAASVFLTCKMWG